MPDDDLDCVVFVNGECTGESGHADGIVVVGDADDVHPLIWSHAVGAIEVRGDVGADLRSFAVAAVREVSLQNGSWRW